MALFSVNHPFKPNYRMGTIGGYFCSVYGCCCGSIQMNGLDRRIMFRVAKIKGRFCLDHALPSLSFLLKWTFISCSQILLQWHYLLFFPVQCQMACLFPRLKSFLQSSILGRATKNLYLAIQVSPLRNLFFANHYLHWLTYHINNCLQLWNPRQWIKHKNCYQGVIVNATRWALRDNHHFQ